MDVDAVGLVSVAGLQVCPVAGSLNVPYDICSQTM